MFLRGKKANGSITQLNYVDVYICQSLPKANGDSLVRVLHVLPENFVVLFVHLQHYTHTLKHRTELLQILNVVRTDLGRG